MPDQDLFALRDRAELAREGLAALIGELDRLKPRPDRCNVDHRPMLAPRQAAPHPPSWIRSLRIQPRPDSFVTRFGYFVPSPKPADAQCRPSLSVRTDIPLACGTRSECRWRHAAEDADGLVVSWLPDAAR
jgi:hypothetical protein